MSDTKELELMAAPRLLVINGQGFDPNEVLTVSVDGTYEPGPMVKINFKYRHTHSSESTTCMFIQDVTVEEVCKLINEA